MTPALPAACAIAVSAPAWPLTIAPGAVVVAEGDSLTYGQDANGPRGAGINGSDTPRSVSPYPEWLGATLRSARVVNRGYPGDRSVDGLLRWARAPAGDVTVLMYGTNDALSPTGRLTAARYQAVLQRLILTLKAAGSAVIVLAPPPTARADANAVLEPYRRAAAQAARNTGVLALDAGEPLRRLRRPFADPVHLKPEGYAAIGAYVAAHIRISPAGPRCRRPRLAAR